MVTVKIVCWVAVMGLSAASLTWVVQDVSAPAASTPATTDTGGTAPQDSPPAASEDTKGAGRELLELTEGLGGFRMPCLDCHRHLGSPTEDPVVRGHGPHQQVVLEHGANNRCFNCHHPDSDKYGSFVAHNGSVIPVETVEELCGKCHGPHYRAWKQGAHGQRSGHWNPDLGAQETAHCNSCHDPHRPFFKPPETLPGPRTPQGDFLPDHPCRKRNH
jgi:hypothetical protein